MKIKSAAKTTVTYTASLGRTDIEDALCALVEKALPFVPNRTDVTYKIILLPDYTASVVVECKEKT